MKWDPLSLQDGASQVEDVMVRVLDKRIEPMVDRSIRQISDELHDVISKAGAQIDHHIGNLSKEIHEHRSMTKDDIVTLIDYAAKQFGDAIDQRVRSATIEASTLINEKLALLKVEFEDAAVSSRKTMYTNVSISVGAALLMATIGLVYKKVSLGELDLLVVFRVALLSCATFSAVLSLLKAVQRWRSMKPAKKSVATVAIGYLGILRPNGAVGLFVLSIMLLAGWAAVTFYRH